MAEHNGELNLVTVEDPVEIPYPGTRSRLRLPTSGFGEERSKHFQLALMHFVRMHPAVGMVSEIRDKMGAQQVLQFIDSGTRSGRRSTSTRRTASFSGCSIWA